MVRVNMEPGRAHAFHKHPTREELIYVLSGRAEQWVGREHKVLGPGRSPLSQWGRFTARTIRLPKNSSFSRSFRRRKPPSPPLSMFPRKSLGGRCALRTEIEEGGVRTLHPQSSILHLQSSTPFDTMATIALLGTMDTKGSEYAYLAEKIQRRGHRTLVIDTGFWKSRRKPTSQGLRSLPQEVPTLQGWLRNMTEARLSQHVPWRCGCVVGIGGRKQVDGVIALGGSGGTAIATAAMRALPIGFPKVMVSILASGNTAPYVGVKDIVMFPSIVDIAGLNRISREMLEPRGRGHLRNGRGPDPASADKPVSSPASSATPRPASNTPATSWRRQAMKWSSLPPTGTGGRTMESLITSGMVAGVLDITTTEWADELVGGVLTRTSAPGSCRRTASRRLFPRVASTW